MRRELTQGLLGGVVLLTLFFLLLIVAPFLLPTTRYRAFAEREIGTRLAADATIETFSFRFLPTPAFTLHGLRVVKAGEELFHFQRVKGVFSIGDLIRHRRFAADLEVEGMKLSALPQLMQAQGGWRYRFRSIAIRDGEIMLQTDASPFVVKGLEGRVRALAPESPTPEDAWQVEIKGTSATGRDMLLMGKISLDAKGHFTFHETQLGLGPLSAKISGNREALRLEVMGLGPEEAATIPWLHQLTSSLSWVGSLDLNLVVKRRHKALHLQTTLDASRAVFSIGDFFSKGGDLPLLLSLKSVAESGNISVQEATLTLGSSSFLLQGSPWVLSLEQLNLTSLKAYLPFLSGVDELVAPVLVVENREEGFRGKLEAPLAALLGLKLTELSVSFVKEAGGIHLQYQGKSFGERVSGRGNIFFDEEPRYEFHAIFDEVAILGERGSLIAEVTTHGTTHDLLRERLSGKGSLLVKEKELLIPLSIEQGDVRLHPEAQQHVASGGITSPPTVAAPTAAKAKPETPIPPKPKSAPQALKREEIEDLLKVFVGDE